MDKTLIQMKVLTKGFRDPMVKFKVMIKRRVAMPQIILVMIWVVLPPAGEEYCCIHKVLLKPYLQLFPTKDPPNSYRLLLGQFGGR